MPAASNHAAGIVLIGAYWSLMDSIRACGIR